MKNSANFSKKSFAVYGLGSTGRSVINHFNRFRIKKYIIWDDNKILKKKWNLNNNKKIQFKHKLNNVDYIILSPGINIKNTEHKKTLLKNKHKIITDLDLFYCFFKNINSIVVTGTNGKSTTCKIIEHVLNKNKIKTVLGGNIGNPVLSLNLKKNSHVIIEASSFQLARSKFIRPNYALILNITNDHLDWHGSMKKYINSKFKIFSLQKRNNYALLDNIKFLSKYKKEKYLGKIKFVNISNYLKIKNSIKNNYLKSKANDQNMSFVYTLSRILNIRKKSFIRSLNSFKGLPHRHEIFLKSKGKVFINDSKATTFEASKFALESNKNIFWIVGGKPKLNDKFKLKKNNNIIKAYIIGKYCNFFVSQLKGKVKFKLSITLKNAIKSILIDIKRNKNKYKKNIILFSPASASYDQFKNFEERGKKFKDLIKLYAKKYN